jgi:hypothetical protein
LRGLCFVRRSTFYLWRARIREPGGADHWFLDIHETNIVIFIDETGTGSDPLNPDTNGNGTIDGEEVFLGQGPNGIPTPAETPTAAPPSAMFRVLL